MVNDAETTARNAEQTTTNDAGMCLQWSRQRAAIASKYGDAATAWRNTNSPHPGDRNPPRGAMAYWTGGSHGYGHIAPSVGGGDVRSTDAGGKGRVATVDVGWPEGAWGLTYAGWAWDVNETTIPHDEEDDDMGELDLNQQITNWSPDDGSAGKITLGKTLNQARGYSEDTYQRLVQLQADVAAIKKALNIT
jgi:hypothetical protein